MATSSENEVLRSKKRARLGSRTLLLAIMAVILGVLLAWLLGFQLPKGASSASESAQEELPIRKTAFQDPNREGRPIRVYHPRKTQSRRSEGSGARAQSRNANNREQVDFQGRPELAQGPCWLSGTLPQNLSGESRVSMTLVSSWAELGEVRLPAQDVKLDGRRFFFNGYCQLAPAFLEVESESRFDLFGPFVLTPYQHLDLGLLQRPKTEIPTIKVTSCWQDSDLTWFLLPKARPGLVSRPLISWTNNQEAGDNASAIKHWQERGQTLSFTVDGDVKFDKTLAGPWDLVAVDHHGRARRLDQIRDGKLGRTAVPLAVTGLEPSDRIILEPDGQKHALLIPVHPSKQQVLLPSPGRPNDRLRLIRFGDAPRDLSMSGNPGQPLVMPTFGTATIATELLTTHTLVRSSLRGADRERVVRRNLLMFGTPPPDLKTATLDADGLGQTGKASATAAQQKQLLHLNPGRYDLVQLSSADGGERRVVKQIDIAEGAIMVPLEISIRDQVGPKFTLVLVDQESGEPIPGAMVAVGHGLPRDLRHIKMRAHTDARGMVGLVSFPFDTMELWATSPRHQPIRRTINEAEFDPGSRLLTVPMTRAPGLSIEVAVDESGEANIDGIALIRRDGQILIQAASGASIEFPCLAPGQYVALPYLGRLSVPTDDWRWLTEESGGLVIAHPARGATKLKWDSPATRRLMFRLTVKGPAIEKIDLQIVHAGAAPFPGLWPDQSFDDLPPGLVQLGRLLPGHYRGIATWHDKTDIADITVPQASDAVIPLHFDFSKH